MKRGQDVRRGRWLTLAAATCAVVLVGCGGPGKKYDQFSADLDFTVAEESLSSDYIVAIDNGDTSGVVADSRSYVQLVEKYRRLGMPKKEALAKLTKEADDLQDYCPECSAILDRERQNILGT